MKIDPIMKGDPTGNWPTNGFNAASAASVRQRA